MPNYDHQTAINTLRFLAVDGVEKAKSGHPGMPMGAAPMAYVLWTRFLKFDPSKPDWIDRDRFVLSAGHGSMLIYGLLHLSGYDVSLDDLKNFRQWESPTPGHPEYGDTPGVETTTGPLGQGIGAAVGMAMAERHLAATFNTPGCELINHRTFVMAGDGCFMEGISAEAASMAGHLGIGKLVVLYDDNHITIEGGTDLAFSEDVGKRFEGHGWQVLVVPDGNDLDAIEAAINEGLADEDRPTLIKVRTSIGYGSPQKQDSASAHGAPLGGDEVVATKENLGWPLEPLFHVPAEGKAPFSESGAAGTKLREAWEAKLGSTDTALSGELKRRFALELTEDWEETLPIFEPGDKGPATRVSAGKALNAVAKALPEFFGGSADLGPSTMTALDGEKSFSRDDYAGRNVHFGVREHAMAAMMNGMANHGGVRPFGSTFFSFTDYMRPAIRLAALMKLPVVHVLTHDSIYLGEDGPTHQPVEHLSSLRAMPGLSIIRPADANETVEAWKLAVKNVKGPTLLILSRQGLPTLDRNELPSADSIQRGGYVVKESSGATPDVILIATGSEVHEALNAARFLENDRVGTRVVNMASWDLFDKQPGSYQEEVLPPTVTKRVSIEAGSTFGWERYVGLSGLTIGVNRFGASAPGNVLGDKFGLTAEAVYDRVKEYLGLN